MAKLHLSHIHLLISQILNRYPDIVEKQILKEIPTIKTLRTLKDTLVFMEENQIITNPHLYIRNCEGYSNHYLIAEVANWKDLYTRIICRNYEEIDVAMYIHSWRKNRLAYLKYHNTLQRKVQNVIEEGPLDYFHAIHPQSTTDKLPKSLEVEPHEEFLIPTETLDKPFDWDYDTRQVFRWLSINYRLSLTEMAKQLGVSRTTIKRKKELIRELAYIHYPTFICSRPNYTRILSSFYTEYHQYIKEILQNLSATCYLFGSLERTLCFINTTLPSYSIEILEELEERSIIEDLNTEIVVRSWNRIEEEYRLGRIPERFFWMFRKGKKDK